MKFKIDTEFLKQVLDNTVLKKGNRPTLFLVFLLIITFFRNLEYKKPLISNITSL